MAILLLVLLSSPGMAQEDGGLFSPSRLGTLSGTLIHPSRFAPARVCAGCHPELFRDWDGSMHSRAHQDPLYLAISRQASLETGGLTDRFCAGCHSPVAVAGGEVPPVGNPAMSRTGAESVGCDFCHTIDRSLGTGNLPAVLDPGRRKRGPRREASSPFHETTFLELSTQAEFCGLCHDVSHPVSGLPIEQTYTEWKNSPYNSPDPRERVYCQDCHLRQRPGIPATGMTRRPDRRNRAATMGPLRDHVYSHYFVGANRDMARHLGNTLQEELAVERIQAAATLEVTDAGFRDGHLGWRVRVTNSGAGHYLPTGLTELREMWIETWVTDGSGATVFSAGRLDREGKITGATAVFHTVLADAAGKPTAKVWEAASILSDRRIPPKETDGESFTASLSGKVRGPLTIRARLLYRSWSPLVAASFLGRDAPASDPVEMAVAETTLHTP